MRLFRTVAYVALLPACTLVSLSIAVPAATAQKSTLKVPESVVLVGDTMTVSVSGAIDSMRVTWASSGANHLVQVLSVNQRRFTFQQAGQVLVSGGATFPRDTALITVLGLDLEPDTLRLQVGASAPVATRFAPGGSVPLHWFSTDSTIATVSGGGLVTGKAVGVTVVRAFHRSVNGGATTLVFVTPAPVARAGECDRWKADWEWCDDFERDRLGAYFDYGSAGGAFVRRDSVGWHGSYGMAATFRPGRTGAGWLRVAFGRVPSSVFLPRGRADSTWTDTLPRVGTDSGAIRHREIWWRFYVRYGPGWSAGGNRLSAATIFSSRAMAQAMVAFAWSPNTVSRRGTLAIDPATGLDASGTVRTTRYEDFARLRFLGTAQGGPVLTDGQWHCVEAHARLDAAGARNAVFEAFVDSVKVAERRDFAWVGRYTQYGINGVVLDNLWPEGVFGQELKRYFDNLVVSRSRVFCNAP